MKLNNVQDDGLDEVRRWKEIVSRQIEELGFADFDKKAASDAAEIVAKIEAERQLRLAIASKRH